MKKIFSSDIWFGLRVPVDKFKFTKKTLSLFTHAADSGDDVRYNFCSHCGKTLCGEITAANLYSVAATALVNNSFSLEMIIYAASAPNWAVFPEGNPKYDILPSCMGN